MKKKILIINGPNLNLLGIREKSIYGNETLSDINQFIEKNVDTSKISLSFFQSNHEGEIIDKLQNSNDEYDGVIINAGGYTHSSVAILDALKSLKIIKLEVHLSNILSREEFRHQSIISTGCDGSIIGMGKYGYLNAINAIELLLHSSK